MAEKLFIPIYFKQETLELKNKTLKKLPKEIAVFYSIQYKQVAEKIKKQLKKTKKITAFSQVLGCTHPKLDKNTKAIIFIGSGKFHAASLSVETDLPVYLYPNLNKVPEKDIKKIKQNKKSSYTNYLNSKNTGILVSIKPGQNKLKQAIELKNKIKDKDTYLFLFNNLDTNEFENYNINSWVNTACPRLDLDSNKIINVGDLNLK